MYIPLGCDARDCRRNYAAKLTIGLPAGTVLGALLAHYNRCCLWTLRVANFFIYAYVLSEPGVVSVVCQTSHACTKPLA